MAYLPKKDEIWAHRGGEHFLIYEVLTMLDKPDPRPIILCRPVDSAGNVQDSLRALSADFWEIENSKEMWNRLHPPVEESPEETREERRKRLWRR